jgi:hypothetical protein
MDRTYPHDVVVNHTERLEVVGNYFILFHNYTDQSLEIRVAQAWKAASSANQQSNGKIIYQLGKPSIKWENHQSIGQT